MGKADKENKDRPGFSNILLRIVVYALFIIVLIQFYVIYKSHHAIVSLTGRETTIKEFVANELERDKESIEALFDSFLKDTSYRGKPVKDITKDDVEEELAPVKEKFEKWYEKKFSANRITHTTYLKDPGIVITVHIPGVRKESVDITVEENVIKINGDLKDGRDFYHTILTPKRADAKSSKVDFDAGPNRIHILFKLK